MYFKLLRANEHNLEQPVHYIIDIHVYRMMVLQDDVVISMRRFIRAGLAPALAKSCLPGKNALIVGLLI